MKGVFVAAVREWDADFQDLQWQVFLINNREDPVKTVLVMSRGKSEDKNTSVLRHGLGTVNPKTAVKIEVITPEIIGFTNEYLVTFFAENKMFERKFTFPPFSISEENSREIPVLDSEGILAG